MMIRLKELRDRLNAKNNDERKEANNFKPARCCENCNFKTNGYFSDMVGCLLLDWSYGNEVKPTQVCDLFEEADVYMEGAK